MEQESLYKGLNENTTANADIPESLANGIGEFVREEILTQPLLQQDKEERLLHSAMSMMERYFSRFFSVLELYSSGGRQAILSWQSEIDAALRHHFACYQTLYQQVSYLQEKPYHMTAWSIAYIVDSALVTLDISEEQYKARNMNVRKKEELEYLISFGGRCMSHLRDNDYIN